MKSIFALGALISAAAAQAPAWAQCGGNGHTGPTTCVSGHSCVVVNGWYHQCQPGASNPPGNGGGSPGGGGGNGKFIFFGTNEAGAEFGQDTLPGVWGKEYTFPEPSTIDVGVPMPHF